MKQMALVKKMLKLMSIPQVIGFESVDQEILVSNYIKRVIPKIQEDKMGNLYLINEGKPLICAHMDTVGSEEAQKILNKIRIVKPGESTGRYNAKGKEIINHKESAVVIGDDNIGADDKCGIAIALELYEKLGDEISLLFTVAEESGLIGIRDFDEELLKKCPYAIVPDRMGSSDIIGVGNNYCTQKFQDEIEKHGKNYGFKPAYGLVSDCDVISDHINCVNLSVGYYEAHREKEYVVLDELQNTYNLIYDIVSSYTEKLPALDKSMNNYGRMGFDYGFNEYDYNGFGYGDHDAIEVFGDEMFVNKSVVLFNSETGRTVTLGEGIYNIM